MKMVWIVTLWLSCSFCVWTASQSSIGYSLNAPDATFEMDEKLEEISGLGLTSDGKYLVAVQDEDGIIFFVDKLTGKLEREETFWKNGDYEGVEVVGDDVFVVKSTGTIYQVIEQNGTYSQDRVEKFNFFLDENNDVEGLAYDALQHRLLLACKAQVGEGKQFKRKKGIYSFDLHTMTLEEEPAYTVSQEEVLTYLSAAPYFEDKDDLISRFHEDADELAFAPSAIAIHPITEHIYVLSSVGKLLLVINKNGEIIHLEKMKKKIHPQPEGLCFDTDGTMYIANEGKKDEPGKIYRFNYRTP